MTNPGDMELFGASTVSEILRAASQRTGALMMIRDNVIAATDLAFAELTGFGETQAVGLRADEVLLPNEEGDGDGAGIHSIRKADGSTAQVIAAYTDFAGNGETFRLAELFDISDRLSTLKLLAAKEQLYSAVFAHAAVGIARVGLDGSWLDCNQRLCDIVGYPRDELLRSSFQAITHEEDLNSDLELLQHTLAGNRDSYSMEKRYLHKDGHVVWANLTVSLVRSDSGEPQYFVSIVDDISNQKQEARTLEFRTERDALTLFHSRYALDEKAAAELYRAQHSNAPLAVLMLDVDRFRDVNERHGHSAGDHVLRAVADVIRDSLRERDLAFRYGGEEFLLLLPRSDLDEAKALGERLRLLLNAHRIPMEQDTALAITVSIGVACYPGDGTDTETLIDSADQALYAAKARGRNCCVSTRDLEPPLRPV